MSAIGRRAGHTCTSCIGEREASRSEVRHVLKRFFGDSRERLLLSLLGDDEISSEGLRRLKEAIASLPDETAGEF